MDGEITTKILIEIRDEIKATEVELAGRLDQTNARLDQTNARLDQTNVRLDRLHRHVIDSEVRLATAITDLAKT